MDTTTSSQSSLHGAQHLPQATTSRATCRHTEAVDVLLQNRHIDHLRPNSRQVTVTNHTGEKQRWPAGLTPLHLAAVMGHADIVSAFARHGRISAESFVVFPGSPLDAAVVGNNPQCVRIVREFVPMNHRGFEGNTCLHMAAQCSSVEIIECLLDLGVCPLVHCLLIRHTHLPRIPLMQAPDARTPAFDTEAPPPCTSSPAVPSMWLCSGRMHSSGGRASAGGPPHPGRP